MFCSMLIGIQQINAFSNVFFNYRVVQAMYSQYLMCDKNIDKNKEIILSTWSHLKPQWV
jgi:hypothetical protein